MRDQDQRQLWRCHHLARLSCSHWYTAAISIAFTNAATTTTVAAAFNDCSGGNLRSCD